MHWEYLAQPQCRLSLDVEYAKDGRNEALRCPWQAFGVARRCYVSVRRFPNP
jgi:hypothetical protein